LFLASDPRRYLENLTRGLGWSAHVLPQEALETALDRVLLVGGERRLNQLRDQAREVAGDTGYNVQFKRLDTLIGALLDTQAAKHLTARQALALTAGRPYDPHRLEIFEALFTALNRSSLPEIADSASSGASRENFASSRPISRITSRAPRLLLKRRRELSSTIKSYKTASKTRMTFLGHLTPQCKVKLNKAGSTLFVLPELVPGTLREEFTRIDASSPSGTSDNSYVCGDRSPSLHRRQWPHGGAHNELHIECPEA